RHRLVDVAFHRRGGRSRLLRPPQAAQGIRPPLRRVPEVGADLEGRAHRGAGSIVEAERIAVAGEGLLERIARWRMRGAQRGPRDAVPFAFLGHQLAGIDPALGVECRLEGAECRKGLGPDEALEVIAANALAVLAPEDAAMAGHRLKDIIRDRLVAL